MKRIISAIIALVLVSCTAIAVSAKESPVATTVTTKPTTTASSNNSSKKTYHGGTVSLTQDPNTNEVTYTFDNKSGYEFTGWNIEGDYTIVSGSLSSGTITVIFNDSMSTSQLQAAAKPEYKKTSGSTSNNEDNDDNTSPKTSDSSIYVILLGCLALGTIVVSKKTLVK